jgi:hypothetical protein
VAIRQLSRLLFYKISSEIKKLFVKIQRVHTVLTKYMCDWNVFRQLWTLGLSVVYVKGKGKVVPVLKLIKHYAMKAYGGVDV